jgi:lipopolysaccharide/colanic/teichoic acid biosynthesis glycosyltransferase
MNDNKDENGNLSSDAKRLTTARRWIRKLSLDEAIMGNMSLIGPRHLLMEYLSLYTSTQRQRLTINPGITGWAKING